MTINITLTELDEHQVYHLEAYLRKQYAVIDYKILPETKELYNTDPTFQKIVKAVKSAQKTRDIYINEHNF